MGVNFFPKYFKEIKSSAKPYYALRGHGTPRLHPTIMIPQSHWFISMNLFVDYDSLFAL